VSGAPDRLLCLPVEGIGEVVEGDDLAALLVSAAARPDGLEDGDVLVVTSKVVSKAEGRTRSTKREEALAGETDRTLARRGGTSIVRTSHGLVLAAAGIDASNVDPGTVVLLPLDPDGSARALREAVARLTGRNVAVLVTDTAGRAWRTGQTDIAIGAAGLEVLEDHAGRTDPYGNELAVTAPAVADELASAADLVKRKLARRPAAVVRGLPGLVLPPGVHGPGAAALVRPEAQDMFGLGAREAVLGALHAVDRRGFGAPCSAVELVAQLSAVVAGTELRVEGDEVVVVRVRGTDWEQGAADARLRAAAFALGWHPAAEARGRGAVRAMLRFGQGTP
jgi:coenzyme F420-0:L-glutamate ligase/coenzyme F420-1:gamma-L-glutamate ligase